MEAAYFSFLLLLSYNAIYYFILTNRGFGKTWAIQIRTWRRAYKRGKKALIVRRFKKEAREMARKIYASADLIKKLRGFVPYDKKTGKGNFKRDGMTFYIKRGGRWVWFLQITALSDANGMRSADDVNCDTIYFDEFTTTPHRYRAYRGDEVTDFVDIFFSAKREHKITCFFLGNRESVANPYFRYFGITPMPSNYEGIRRYRSGSIVVQYVNNEQKEKNGDYDKKLRALFADTAYGNYIYNSEYKNANAFRRAKPPLKAAEYISLYWNGYPLTISVQDGFFYVKSGVDASRRIYCDVTPHKYKQEFQLIKRQRQIFSALMQAVFQNRMYYDSEATYEAMQSFYKWLGI